MDRAARISGSRHNDSLLGRLVDTLRYFRRNKSLGIGLGIFLLLFVLWLVGSYITEPSQARPFSSDAPVLPPSSKYWLGSDINGREILAVIVEGFPATLLVGITAGFVGIFVGTILAFAAAYYGGVLDSVVRGVVDVFQTVPGLLVLIVIAISLPNTITVWQMAVVISALSWLTPARTIRSQVLVLKERPFVEMAKLSGMSGPAIIVREMMPNLMPFIFASFVLAVSSAILFAVGIEVLGLGPFDQNTIGVTIYRASQFNALNQGWWWWFGPPVLLIVIMFIGLFLISVGLDEWANPRLRRRV